MKQLTFKYNIFNVPGSGVFPLNQTAKAKFEIEKSKKFEMYLERINACDGFYNVRSVSSDGLTFSGNLAADIELLEEINEKLPGGAV